MADFFCTTKMQKQTRAKAVASRTPSKRGTKPAATGKTSSMSAICGSPTSRRAEQLIRLAEILERTPQEILRYFLDFLTGRSPQYRDAYELTYLFDSFPYSRRAKRRVRRKLAAMVRTEQAFPHPEHNERAARQIELGRTLK